MLRIAICPNAFRGSLTALEATEAIAQGFRDSRLDCETLLMPLADGGNGTLDVWLKATQGQKISVLVENPVGEIIQAYFGVNGKTALIEMAQASGIELLAPVQRNPLFTSTFGTGQLIQAALEYGATEILIGIGGSATVDGGAGCLQALGARLLDADGNPIQRGGDTLNQLSSIEVAPVIQQLKSQDIKLRVLCDVDNPLIGNHGAAQMFGPQKGADSLGVQQLEENLTHYATVVQRDLGISIANMPYGGAAGGLSAGLSLIGAEMVSGVETLIQVCGYQEKIATAHLVITGEGKFDEQTAHGKAPLGITRLAQSHHIPIIIITGTLDLDIDSLNQLGVAAGFSIIPYPCTLSQAIDNAFVWLKTTAQQIGNLLALTHH